LTLIKNTKMSSLSAAWTIHFVASYGAYIVIRKNALTLRYVKAIPKVATIKDRD